MALAEIEYKPLDAFLKLKHLPHLVFLDSSRFHSKHGRYSFLAADPIVKIETKEDKTEIKSKRGCLNFRGDPWEILDSMLSRFRAPTPELSQSFPNGAAIGFLGYELGQWLENVRIAKTTLVPSPDLWFGFYDVVFAFDHLEKKAWLISSGLDEVGCHSYKQAEFRKDQFLDELQSSISPFPSQLHSQDQIVQLISQREHENAIRKALQYIRQGDIYQVNLTHPFLGTLSGSSHDIYLRLRQSNPAPFAAYLDFGAGQILSSSPERFLKLDHRRVQTRPIKGTSPRTGNQALDKKSSEELLNSEKCRAELLMITDLLRNDLGKIAEFGSVKVPELVGLEEYEAVFHLVSTVEAQLKSNILHLDTLAACFPGGSITGAPKIRSMEIIQELEPYKRGPYTGSLGYIGFNGVSDFNILIRTLVHQNGRVSFHVGGGIVADSDPTLEYEETLHKARAILKLWQQNSGSSIQSIPGY